MRTKHRDLKPSKTYATKENAIKAVEKLFNHPEHGEELLHFTVVCNEEGRYFPICMHDAAVKVGAFAHFVTIS